MAATTIKTYLAGIQHKYIATNRINPLVLNNGQHLLHLQLVLRGIYKLQTVTTKPRLPIAYTILCKLCTMLCNNQLTNVFDPYTDTMLNAVITLAFFALK